MPDLLDQDASSQLVALASKRISSVELLKLSLARHAETHAKLNAVVAADPERALERARALDDARLRGGGIIGEHSVTFAADDEILTLSHSARDRGLFARGAVAAARWVAGRPAGEYDMQDVLGFAKDR